MITIPRSLRNKARVAASLVLAAEAAQVAGFYS
jgi:hypothetical protein